MKISTAVFATCLCFFTSKSPAVTPMDTPIKDGGLTEIECAYDLDEKKLFAKMDMTADKGVYHYTVYVPADYSTNPQKQYPCLFIFSPNGNAQLGAVKDYVAKNQWIAVMLKESKNGPMAPSCANFLAAHDDAVKRLRIKEGSKVVTGLSGGARAASHVVGARPGFAGMILQGAGFNYYGNGEYVTVSLKQNKSLRVFVLFGDTDSNIKESKWLEDRLPNFTKLKIVTFKGGHDWAPAESMEQALTWVMEKVVENETATKPKITQVPLDATRPARTWTATTGAVFQGSLLRSEGDFVYLKATDGSERKVLISFLGPADQTYISSMIPH